MAASQLVSFIENQINIIHKKYDILVFILEPGRNIFNIERCKVAIFHDKLLLIKTHLFFPNRFELKLSFSIELIVWFSCKLNTSSVPK